MPITNILQPIAIPPASTNNNGLMTSADKQTLNGLVTNTITNSGDPVTLTLANNTVYELTATALTSLTLSGVATGFEYASVTFTSGSTATVFAMPATGWYCIGSEDCNNGAFTPATDMRYNLAICQETGRIAVYVMRAL